MPLPNQSQGQTISAHDITGVAISNKAILLLSAIGFVCLGAVIYFLILRQKSNLDNDDQGNVRDDYDEVLDQSNVAKLNRSQRRAKAKFRMKRARRAAAPHGSDGAAGQGVDANVDTQRVNDDEGVALLDASLSRKERKKAAKAMEKEERKLYAQKARVWRESVQKPEKEHSGSKTESECDTTKFNPIQKESSEIMRSYPRKKDESDALSEFIFWESKSKMLSSKVDEGHSLDKITLDRLSLTKRMTIRAFFHHLKASQSVSVMSLADEFGIDVSDAVKELDHLNERFGMVGCFDDSGNFVYASKELINHCGEISYISNSM